MFEFAFPWLFLLLPIPLILRVLLPSKHAAAQLILRLPYLTHAGTSQPQLANRSVINALPAWLFWAALVTAAASPTWLDEPISIPNEGRDIMLAVDLSGSMREQDMAYNGRWHDRLSVVKAVLSEFIEKRQGDQLGLILFADTAFLQTPLTRDVKTVRTMLAEAQIGLVGRATAIGDALGLAVKRFDKKSDSNKVLVLLTDGQNTAGNLKPSEALLLAKDAGIKVYTIGVGSDSQGGGFFTMNMGSPIDEKLLKEIAEQTGGQYFRATDTQSLAQIYQQLDTLEPLAKQEVTFRPKTALFYIPLLIALALLLCCLIAQQGFTTIKPVKGAPRD